MARLEVEHIIPRARGGVESLHLDNDPDALVVRSYWVLAGWHPPVD
jgi:hypothetical protein